jgi:hypothetical protein
MMGVHFDSHGIEVVGAPHQLRSLSGPSEHKEALEIFGNSEKLQAQGRK